MATAVALWSAVVEPGKKTTIVPPANVKVTNVALSDILEDQNGRTTVKISYESLVKPPDDDEADFEGGEETTAVICSLTGGKIEQAVTEIFLMSDESYTFHSVGKNTIHLIGNYIDQSSGPDGFPSGYSDDSDSEEEAFDLRDVSSDVEMELDPAEIESDSSRFEEVDDNEDKPKSLKRPRDSTEGGIKETKAEKKAKKKAKAADGTALPVTDSEKKDAPKKPETEKKEQKKEKKPAGQEKEIAGGIKIVDATIGTGPQAKKGNTVRMRYIGKLQNGKVFDQNTKGKPFTFHLGKGEVIKGWDEGIVGMQVNGERTLTIPPAMGYGKRGAGKDIPPNSTLIFEVKLLEIK